ncbi:MAG TPA: ABC transporter permease [Ilumatobacter sp.]|nr:ABC transporter permease [Ilumatobacter sp.]
MNYWLQRVGMAVLLLLTVSALTFGAMNVLGDPLFNILGPAAADVNNPANAEKIAAARAEYNLDDPLPVRYVKWLGDFVTGDMGVQFSSTGQPPVTNLIQERLPRTLTLLVMAQAFAVVLAVPWALFSASKANKTPDKVSTLASFAMIALPAFALAVILKYLLAIKLGWFPLAYRASDSFPKRLWQTVLPALTIALPAAAVYQRLLRTDLITTLQEDFILMARSKGVSRRDVLYKHALRPSLFSFVTVFGINTGALIGGAFVVEKIFLIPGLGLTIVESIAREDFPVVLAIVMIVTAAFVVLNVLIDVLYSLIDPRVRAS